MRISAVFVRGGSWGSYDNKTPPDISFQSTFKKARSFCIDKGFGPFLRGAKHRRSLTDQASGKRKEPFLFAVKTGSNYQTIRSLYSHMNGTNDLSTDMELFLSQVAKKFCPQCGGEVPVDPTGHQNGRPRVFCSAECRKEYWREHPKVEVWKSFEQKTCPVCGRTFPARKERTRQRTYCSHACANRARARKES